MRGIEEVSQREEGMSGGSMDYLCYKVEEVSFALGTPQRKAFRKHLHLISKALKAIEWNDSGDGAENEEELIRKCLGKGAVLDACVEDARRVLRELTAELEKVK